MAWMQDASVKERLDKLNAAIGKMPEIMETGPVFSKNCEELFGEFRLRCVHLRKESAALDAAEPKDVAWQFICRFHKTCPFQHKRCEEVLKLLMLSDAWMACFVDGAEDMNFEDLPEAIQDEFKKRHQEAVDHAGGPKASEAKQSSSTQQPKEEKRNSGSGSGGPAEGALAFSPPSKVAFMVQRCSAAKVSANANMHQGESIGPGLCIAMTFLQDASEDTVRWLCKFILTNKQLSADPDSGASSSVVDLCQKGRPQGILIYPQGGLSASAAEDGTGINYTFQGDQAEMKDLYTELSKELRQQSEVMLGKDAVESPAGGFRGGIKGRIASMVSSQVYLPHIVVVDDLYSGSFAEVTSSRTWFFQF
mmetsp:Transcript_42364/g.76899  ORF Transcript_42364/g.76899 Transcript_42364/m.76899 type:complete len:364 (-) Transcript_42364:126-1217(-)